MTGPHDHAAEQDRQAALDAQVLALTFGSVLLRSVLRDALAALERGDHDAARVTLRRAAPVPEASR